MLYNVMATAEHKKLATIIKDTHRRLRAELRIYGVEEAWNRHVIRTDDLQNYAESMQELATAHWKSNSPQNTHCRIKWIKHQCYEYFLNGGKDKYDQREIDIANKANYSPSTSELSHLAIHSQSIPTNNDATDKKISVLDVGSCYNPLGDDSNLDVTAIDLAPYSNCVLQCDFLNAIIGTEIIICDNHRTIKQLGKNCYDVCVFSLLLEYFPCPEQRFQCCKKAQQVLKDAGILIIITPDSKHIGANAKFMKSWRFVLAKLGFMRINYEKLQHLHCICFRKCRNNDVAVRWANMQTFSTNDILFSCDKKIYIPQDFQTKCTEEKCEKIVYNADDLVIGFDELPELIND